MTGSSAFITKRAVTELQDGVGTVDVQEPDRHCSRTLPFARRALGQFQSFSVQSGRRTPQPCLSLATRGKATGERVKLDFAMSLWSRFGKGRQFILSFSKYQSVKIILEERGWRDGSKADSTGCSSRQPGFISKHLNGGSQPPITPVPRSLMLSFGIYRCCMHTCRKTYT